MKKFLSLLAVVFTLGLSTVALDAEAKRIGSGKSMGMQRQAAPDKGPGASPSQSAAAPATAGAAGAAGAASSRSWMGPIAGIAAGLGIAALASHLGFGEELASMLMFGLMAAAIMVAIGFFMRKRAAAQQPQAARAGGMQYAPAGAPGSAAPAQPAFRPAMPAGGGSMIGSALSGGSSASAATHQIPADFDVASFTRNAKVNFIRLQAASDIGNLNDIREFTTPEMFAELKMELSDRGMAEQHTDVVTLDADVIEVEEGADRYVVSVRFTGTVREEAGAPAEAFDELWHLVKARQGNTGWLLAGIQQMQ